MCVPPHPSASIGIRSMEKPCKAIWAIGAVGSALPSHGRGHRFESGIAHERPHSTGGVLRFRNPLPHPLPASTVTAHDASTRGGIMTGQVSFIEFGGRDAMTARTFYGKLFGWSFEPGPGGEGYAIDGAGVPAGRPRRRRGRLAVRVLPRRRPRGGGRGRRAPRRHRRGHAGRRRRGRPPRRSASSGCAATTRGRRSACTVRPSTEPATAAALTERPCNLNRGPRSTATRAMRSAPAVPMSRARPRARVNTITERTPRAACRGVHAVELLESIQDGRPWSPTGRCRAQEVAVAVVRLAREAHGEDRSASCRPMTSTGRSLPRPSFSVVRHPGPDDLPGVGVAVAIGRVAMRSPSRARRDDSDGRGSTAPGPSPPGGAGSVETGGRARARAGANSREAPPSAHP